eukprot:829522-Rhodomonas_salina.1
MHCKSAYARLYWSAPGRLVVLCGAGLPRPIGCVVLSSSERYLSPPGKSIPPPRRGVKMPADAVCVITESRQYANQRTGSACEGTFWSFGRDRAFLVPE